MDKCSVCVILPVYNGGPYLQQAINSVLEQEYEAWELILIDDGSTDESGRICDGYAQRDARIRVVYQSNAGVSAARNAGLALAKGTYVTFLDSDDLWEPGFLAFAVAEMEQTGAALLVSGIAMEGHGDVQCFSGNRKLYSCRAYLEARGIAYSPLCFCGPAGKLYRRTLLEKHQIRFPEELSLGEDTEFNMAYLWNLEAEETVLFDGRCFYRYRRKNPDSLYGRYRPDRYEVENRIFCGMRRLLAAKGCGREAETRLKEEYLEQLLGCIHREFDRWRQSTRMSRREVLGKVSCDPVIQDAALREVRGWKRKGLVCLLKWHRTGLIYGILLCCYWGKRVLRNGNG